VLVALAIPMVALAVWGIRRGAPGPVAAALLVAVYDIVSVGPMTQQLVESSPRVLPVPLRVTLDPSYGSGLHLWMIGVAGFALFAATRTWDLVVMKRELGEPPFPLLRKITQSGSNITRALSKAAEAR
jgi:hypothetical protein